MRLSAGRCLSVAITAYRTSDVLSTSLPLGYLYVSIVRLFWLLGPFIAKFLQFQPEISLNNYLCF